VISQVDVPTATAPPFSFTLPYDPARINADHRYSVRARIMADDKLMFQSDAGYAVLGSGNVTNVDILLKRVSAETSVASTPAQNLRGMYSYMADAGWFVDCRSGIRLAVAQEGDNAALETAYTKDQRMPGAPLLATVEGRVEDRMPMEGPGPRPTLIVEKFISIAPEGCSGPSSTALLENTYWKLITLNNTSVESSEGTRELHLVLNSQDQRVKGFAGCNNFMGAYQLEGPKITFSRVAGTMMACAGDMSVEQHIHEMLSRVIRWKISGETLQLTNDQGIPLATFESRYMR
jgi:copper homeostasis protein (lipoprotein)